MSLNVKQPEGGDFEPIPEGVYTARCFRVVDLGTQENTWLGEIKFMPQIMVTWEILDDKVKMDDGRPFAISKTYTASLSEKSNLYKDLVAWRGRAFTKEELLGFDISKLAGAYCQIQIIHKPSQDGSRIYARINTIMKTDARPKGVNDLTVFDINNPDMEVFESFTDWLKDKIRGSEEWKAKEIVANDTGENRNKSINAEDIDIDSGVSDSPALENLTEDAEEFDSKDIPF